MATNRRHKATGSMGLAAQDCIRAKVGVGTRYPPKRPNCIGKPGRRLIGRRVMRTAHPAYLPEHVCGIGSPLRREKPGSSSMGCAPFTNQVKASFLPQFPPVVSSSCPAGPCRNGFSRQSAQNPAGALSSASQRRSRVNALTPLPTPRTQGGARKAGAGRPRQDPTTPPISWTSAPLPNAVPRWVSFNDLCDGSFAHPQLRAPSAS